jgi:uncharacterized heparinase superfamily protein
MKPAERILRTVHRSMQTVAYGNPIYRKMLASGESPERLFFTLPDPWPGDSQAGLALISDQHSLFGDPALQRPGAALRNLRAVGSDAARRRALALIEGWLDRHDQWEDVEWSPERLGDRIAGWIGFYEFYAPEAEPEFIARVATSLHRQWKHLTRALSPSLNGIAGLRAIKGLVYGGLNFDEGDKSLGLAIDLLKRQLKAEILLDGGHIARCPSTQLHMLRHLIDLREAFKAAGIEIPDNLRPSIHAMLPVLKLLRHGDGGLSLFHGSIEESPLLIDAVFTLADVKCRALRRLPDTGYERLTAGRSLLIVDTAAPPPRGHDRSAHVGLLSFEFGHGRERLIVNCGAALEASDAWRVASAATAAHSTLTVEDCNACDVLPSGSLASSAEVAAQRYEEDGYQCVEMKHDGYRDAYGILYRRLLKLSANGEELAGREELIGAAGRSFALRWHLHPASLASLAHGGQTALVRSASGAGWRLRVEGAELSLEAGVYCGSGAPRRSLQVKASGATRGGETVILWSFAREKIG